MKVMNEVVCMLDRKVVRVRRRIGGVSCAFDVWVVGEGEVKIL